MRLKPPVSEDEAFHILLTNAALSWGPGEASLLHEQLRSIASAMATVSALDIPEDTEPLFAENPVGLEP
jgi:hypothetical protein